MNVLTQRILVVSVIINILTIIAVVLLKKNLPPVVPLFYGLPVSQSTLMPSIGLTIPPIISILLTGINSGIAKISRDKFLEKILTGLVVFVTALSVITVTKIILLVGVF